MDAAHLAQIESSLLKRQSQTRRRLHRLSHQAKQFWDRGSLQVHDLRRKSSQILASAGLAGTLILSPIAAVAPFKNTVISAQTQSLSSSLSSLLAPIVPHYPTKLPTDTSSQITQVIKEQTGITAVSQLEGQSLNHQVGYVGYEQHLKRYPGDDLDAHDDEQIAGIAPGLGAWGYFASDKDHFTTQDYLHEKYYSVAQTLYLENWNRDFRFLRDWYKYRKILIVNPANGSAVVTVLGDAGPAEWTGKQFGASPEAMKALNLHLGPRKGLVLFLFVDDPEDKIPLGPVTEKIRL